LVPGPHGEFLSLSFSGNLDSINPATGITTVVGATGLGDCSGGASLCPANSAFCLVQFNGTYYATDVSNTLYKVNPATGAATLLGPAGIPFTPFKLDSSNPVSDELGRAGLFFSDDEAGKRLNAFRVTYEPFLVGISEYLPGWLPTWSLIIGRTVHADDGRSNCSTMLRPAELRSCCQSKRQL
jgi:hypothetical protein